MLENTALNSNQENVANKKKKKKINNGEYKNFWFLFNVLERYIEGRDAIN